MRRFYFACGYVCVLCTSDVCGGQKKVLDLLEVELQMIVSYCVCVWS